MSATIIVVAIVAGLFLFVILRMIFSSSGRPGGTDTSYFPYNTGTSIAPPSWSPDSGVNDVDCGTGTDNWGGSDGDSGSCDSGGGD